MPKYVVPDSVVSLLEQLEQGTQLCDASGRAVGFFVPTVSPTRCEAIEPELSNEELRQIEQSTEWYTTAEVLRHLESLK